MHESVILSTITDMIKFDEPIIIDHKVEKAYLKRFQTYS